MSASTSLIGVNMCREMVLYVPLWKGNTEDSAPWLDADGDAIPELIAEDAIWWVATLHLHRRVIQPSPAAGATPSKAWNIVTVWSAVRAHTSRLKPVFTTSTYNFHLHDMEPMSLTDIDASPDPTSAADSDTDSDIDTGDAFSLTGTARFFRCGSCDDAPTLQCEHCSFEMHLCHRDHEVQEWSPTLGNWMTGHANTMLLGERFAIHCSSCARELAPPGRGLPSGIVHCGICDSGVMCYSCCKKEHKCKPLHRLRKWTGDRWRTSSLKSIGYVFQMGHRGDTLVANFYECDTARAGSFRGECTLDYPGACSTFRVLR
ncbi:hypothetical protein C8R47DRAFT_1230310 [Mycena vitilis]|nr:hypothetical protein C8R47DRAFT_1230310 [Mycena vitilis]